jgi:hypothetical protein
VDGEIKYVSILPSTEEMAKCFADAIAKKGI